jgi:TetR/AcrR family transcriptional repressor of nem operon
MRKSKQETAQTRQRIVEAASEEFRRSGIDGTGLNDLMAAAGLTHGGFYKHFDSKEQVVEESLAFAVESMLEAWTRKLSSAPFDRRIHAAIADYLSVPHRDDPAGGCPFAALGSEVARGSDAAREAMTRGFLDMVKAMAGQLEDLPPAAARKEAVWKLSAMIGALTMARVVTDPELSATILREARKRLIGPS